MASRAEAVEALTALGLSEYEARCFVALTQLSAGTAKEIAQVADVPQSRVYDVTEELFEVGLVDIEESDPKRYFALPVETALTTLHREYSAHLDTAAEHLKAMSVRRTENDGVWEIANHDAVRNRVTMHVRNATDEVYLLVAREELLEDDLVAALEDAGATGVTVWAEVPTERAQRRLHGVLPDARIAVTEFSAGGVPQRPGRLLMADGETTLLSVQREGLVPDDVEESGVWGTAVCHGLVAWPGQLLDARRERTSFETA